jgi:glycosyltransferase involved in cell wall biosynthesis
MKICVLSHSQILDDVRVVKFCEALAHAGHEIIAIGYTTKKRITPTWATISIPPPQFNLIYKISLTLKAIIASLCPALTLTNYFSIKPNKIMLDTCTKIKADIYQAHNWLALPIAAIAAKINQSNYHYDCHEYSTQEHLHNLLWKLFFPTFIRNIEAMFATKAHLVTTVSNGIAQQLKNDYKLTKSPEIILNSPLYHKLKITPPSATIRVLYHGTMSNDRGLELLIKSVPFWPNNFILILRGCGKPTYIRKLKNIISKQNCSNKIYFETPVSYPNLIEKTNLADIGIHPMLPNSIQTKYALPNKFFEYIFSGLAVCVMDNTEMAAIVKTYGIGFTIHTSTPEKIGELMHSFTPSKITTFKCRSLQIAPPLSWNTYQKRLLNHPIYQKR